MRERASRIVDSTPASTVCCLPSTSLFYRPTGLHRSFPVARRSVCATLYRAAILVLSGGRAAGTTREPWMGTDQHPAGILPRRWLGRPPARSFPVYQQNAWRPPKLHRHRKRDEASGMNREAWRAVVSDVIRHDRGLPPSSADCRASGELTAALARLRPACRLAKKEDGLPRPSRRVAPVPWGGLPRPSRLEHSASEPTRTAGRRASARPRRCRRHCPPTRLQASWRRIHPRFWPQPDAHECRRRFVPGSPTRTGRAT